MQPLQDVSNCDQSGICRSYFTCFHRSASPDLRISASQPLSQVCPSVGAYARLILVGTDHGDDQGLRRTNRFLHSVQPDLVFVELSPYAKAFRLTHQVSLQRTLNRNLRAAATKFGMPLNHAHTHPEIKAIRRQLALPFEYRAARRYFRSTGNRLLLVDYSPFSRRLIQSWPELLSPENLASLLSLPRNSRPSVSNAYHQAARHIRAEGQSGAVLVERAHAQVGLLWEKRERHMADTIRSALQRQRPARAVYLGGWQHLAPGGSFPSIRELLGIGLARCILLDRDFL
jgi:hypothetical protein